MNKKTFWFHFILSAFLVSASAFFALRSSSWVLSAAHAITGFLLATIVVRRLWPAAESHAS